jgi:hypothetical protein
MSRHLRFCFAACVLSAGLATAPASSNPLTDLFRQATFGQTAPAQPTPAQPTAQAPAEEQCLSRPGKTTAPGQHWFYHLDGHRKCWFQAAQGTAQSKKSARDRATKHTAAAKENEAAPAKPRAAANARAELPSPSPAQAPDPAPRAPEIKVVDAATDAPTLVPAVPVGTHPAADQFTPEHPTPPQVDVEKLLATAPPATDAVASYAPPATSVAVPTVEAGENARGASANWLGALLMTLGFVSVLSASRAVRSAMPLRRETGLPAIAYDDAGNVLRPRSNPQSRALVLRDQH